MDEIPEVKKKSKKNTKLEYGDAGFDYELSKYDEFAKNIKKRQVIIKKILSQYKEFAGVDPASIEANLIVQAITQMGSNKAGAAARNYIDQKARLLGPAATNTTITISFWNPLEDMTGPLEEKPEEPKEGETK